MPTDAELVTSYLSGSSDAAAELLRRHGPPVYRLLCGMVGQEWKDVAQETFLKVFANLAVFDRERSFRAWVMTIARRTAIDFIRRTKLRHLERPLSGDMPNGDNGSEDDRVRQAREFARRVRQRMLRWLIRYTDATRAAQLRRAALMWLRGRSYADIAKRCRYRSADAARITLRSAVKRTLDHNAVAGEEARRIAADTLAEYRMLGGRPSATVRFLNVLDVRPADGPIRQ